MQSKLMQHILHGSIVQLHHVPSCLQTPSDWYFIQHKRQCMISHHELSGCQWPRQSQCACCCMKIWMACRDVEVPFATSAPPSGVQRLKNELQQNWWLWGSVAFAVILIGSLVIFRNSLYTKTGYGLPFLAGEILLCIFQVMFSTQQLWGCLPYCHHLWQPSHFESS